MLLLVVTCYVVTFLVAVALSIPIASMSAVFAAVLDGAHEWLAPVLAAADLVTSSVASAYDMLMALF